MDDLDDDIDELFDSATNFVRLNVSSISKDNLLYLYARFKQATEGECNIPRPGGLFNFEAKSKYDAWKALGNTKSKESAMREYLERVDSLFLNWRTSNKTSNGRGTFGHHMSMMKESEALDDDKKSLSDWCKEGQLDKLKQVFENVKDINEKKELLNKKDADNGMTLLMWACDRGQTKIVKHFLHHYSDLININSQDNDGQTSLHYAACSEHVEIVKELLKNKTIDFSLVDSEGVRADEMTTNTEIIRLIKSKAN